MRRILIEKDSINPKTCSYGFPWKHDSICYNFRMPAESVAADKIGEIENKADIETLVIGCDLSDYGFIDEMTGLEQSRARGIIMAYEIHCKNCGRILLRYEKYERKYKSPVACCKKCGTEYIDPRCHELAIEGIPEAEFKVTNGIFLFLVGALIAWRGYYLFGMRMLGTPDSMQWFLPTVILLLGLALIIGAIIDLIRIFTGSKRRKYERLLEESRVRIRNDAYVRKLRNLGYLREGASE